MIFPDIELEKKLWDSGVGYVVGLDEAGRGPLAGPVTAGAVCIDIDTPLNSWIRDSKKMTEKRREEVFEWIKENSIGYGIGMIEAEVIDEVGIQEAVRMAMVQALRGVEGMLKSRADYLIIDGNNVLSIAGYEQEKLIKGDLYHYSISCASILAKVTRDRYMHNVAHEYPVYGFEKHVGYGTKYHMEMLNRYGPCVLHRKSFGPVARLLV